MRPYHSYIYNKVKSLIAFFTLTALCSCGAEDSISHKFLCQFTFLTQNHPGNTLEVALTGQGTYTFVKASYEYGVWHILSTPNDGRNYTENISITSAIEKQYATYSNLGANNGIIIGQTNFNGRVAYDRQCPNCINQYGGTYYPLEWDETNRQQVVCSKCHRTYALETGGVVDGGSGVRLMQYPITYTSYTTGGGMIIRVQN